KVLYKGMLDAPDGIRTKGPHDGILTRNLRLSRHGALYFELRGASRDTPPGDVTQRPPAAPLPRHASLPWEARNGGGSRRRLMLRRWSIGKPPSTTTLPRNASHARIAG